MKRSEMLYIIVKIMHDADYHAPRGKIANDILTNLEEAGMKPPVSKNCPVLLTTTHTWEPENEKDS